MIGGFPRETHEAPGSGESEGGELWVLQRAQRSEERHPVAGEKPQVTNFLAGES